MVDLSEIYCEVAPGHPLHGPYHDHEYGFPDSDERVMFERLVLEITQAGLSWELVLKKRSGLKAAFAGFNPAVVAQFGEAECRRLLKDSGIVRNRRKIEAVIENARRITAFRQSHGSFDGWLRCYHPLAEKEWVALFRRHLMFTGPIVTREFLTSMGYLPGAHRPDCPVYQEIVRRAPPWLTAAEAGFRFC